MINNLKLPEAIIYFISCPPKPRTFFNEAIYIKPQNVVSNKSCTTIPVYTAQYYRNYTGHIKKNLPPKQFIDFLNLLASMCM